MMIPIGTFFFRYRNVLFPLVFVLLFFEGTWPICENELIENLEIVIGIIVALSGQALRALTIGLDYIKRGGKNKQVYAKTLVQNGMFAHCRNPLYLGNLLIFTGIGVVANSLLFVLFGIPFFLFAYMAIICSEENYLENKFGQEFKDYCKRVNRIIPDFSGLPTTIQSMEFSWRRLIIKEYTTTFLWITGVLLLIIKNIYLGRGYETSKYTLLILSVFLLMVFLGFCTAWHLKKSKILRLK